MDVKTRLLSSLIELRLASVGSHGFLSFFFLFESLCSMDLAELCANISTGSDWVTCVSSVVVCQRQKMVHILPRH